MNRRTLLAGIIGLSLTGNATHAARTKNKAPRARLTIPNGCEVTKSWEDGSALAICSDGTLLVHDGDGDAFCGKKPGWYTQAEEATWRTKCTEKYRKANKKGQ